MPTKEHCLTVVRQISRMENENHALRAILDNLRLTNGNPLEWRVWMRQLLDDPQSLGVASEKYANTEKAVRDSLDDESAVVKFFECLT